MRRFVATLVAIAAATFGGLAVATPAHAGPGQEGYAVLLNGQAVKYWLQVQELKHMCWECLYMVEFPEQEKHPEWLGGLMEGLDQLSQASVARDERTAEALRAAAMDSFTGAARDLGGATPRPGPASAYDPATGRTFPVDAPWLDAAQADIAAGMTALQQSFEDPLPYPSRQRAARLFDKAFTEISTKRVL